jgi:hypothetical protein
MGEMRNADNIFVEKPEGKRPFEKPRRRGKNNIRMGFRETGREREDWIHLAQERDH